MVAGPDGELTVDATAATGVQGPLAVTRLLLTPICHPAPPGIPGDVVRVSVGATAVYLLPADVEGADEATLREMLAAGGPAGDAAAP